MQNRWLSEEDVNDEPLSEVISRALIGLTAEQRGCPNACLVCRGTRSIRSCLGGLSQPGGRGTRPCPRSACRDVEAVGGEILDGVTIGEPTQNLAGNRSNSRNETPHSRRRRRDQPGRGGRSPHRCPAATTDTSPGAVRRAFRGQFRPGKPGPCRSRRHWGRCSVGAGWVWCVVAACWYWRSWGFLR